MFTTPTFTFKADTFTAPVEKLVSLNLEVFKKTVDVQTETVNSLFELTDTRLKAMAKIKDAEDLKTFVKEQNELAQESFTKAISNTRSAVTEVEAYNNEVMNIVNESIETAKAATVQKAA